MMSKKMIFTVLFILLVLNFGINAEHFSADKTHSSISFTISHMVVSKVRGTFNDFSVELSYDEKDISKSTAVATIKTASIDTRNEKRDNHLKSPDFFDVAKFPEMSFKSTGIKKEGDKLALVGILKIRDVSKQITIPFKILGKMKDPRGKTRLGIEGFTLLDRKDFGVNWNRALDKGGFVLGNQINVEILLELISK